MKVTFFISLLALMAGLYVIENMNVNIAISLYDRDCAMRVANADSDVFIAVRFAPSLITGLLVSFACIFIAMFNEWSNDPDLKKEDDVRIDGLVLFICLVFSSFYFVIVSLEKYRECTDRHGTAIALVVVPVIVPTSLVLIYLFIKRLLIPCYVACRKGVSNCEEVARDIKEVRNEIKETKEMVEEMRTITQA